MNQVYLNEGGTEMNELNDTHERWATDFDRRGAKPKIGSW